MDDEWYTYGSEIHQTEPGILKIVYNNNSDQVIAWQSQNLVFINKKFLL